MTLRDFLPFEDGTYYREVTPENYTEGPFMSFAMESTILCGRKEVGVVLTTQWLSHCRIIPLVRLSVLAKYYSKIRRLLPELDITL